MTQAAEAIRAVLAGSDELSDAQLLSSCGAAVARSAPSTSGTLVATGFLRASKAASDHPQGGVETVQCAFVAATDGIKARGKASVGDRTLVDGLDAVCNSLELSLFSGLDVKHALKMAATVARSAAEATAEMEPKVGRASWVPERAKGHPDAGCWMLAIALQAVAASLSTG